jgi:2-methylfumaryl-CoA isomerase
VTALEDSLGVDFTLESDRYQCRELLAALLQRWFGERDYTDVRAVLSGTSVLWSPYQSFGELVEDGQLNANPLMAEVDQPGVGPHLAPGSPIRTAERVAAARAPALGEHTDAILSAWLGLRPDEVQALHDRGVVQGGTGDGSASAY